MCQFFSSDYSLADIKRFAELSIRSGSTLASLERRRPDDVRVVSGAALLGLFKENAASLADGEPVEKAALLGHFARFLSGPGSWLRSSPEEFLERALADGLLKEARGAAKGGRAYKARMTLLPGVAEKRLADELEAARETLALRRAHHRAAMQKKNQEVNSSAPKADREADERFMRMALEEAASAAAAGEVPVGAVLAGESGEVLARAHNRTLRDRDPTAHAEVLALREAARKLGRHRLTGTTLYATLEPCPMCAGAIAEARCRRIVYGAPDERRGALEGALALFAIPGVNHRPRIDGGILSAEAEALLAAFFAERRRKT